MTDTYGDIWHQYCVDQGVKMTHCLSQKSPCIFLIKSHLQPPHAAHSVALCVGTGPTGGYFVSWLLRPSFYVSMTFAVNKRHLSFVKFNDYNKNPLDNHIAILHC